MPNGAPHDADAAELIALDDALTELDQLSVRLARIVELRFFAGLSVEATAEVLGKGTRLSFPGASLGGAADLQVLPTISGTNERPEDSHEP